MAAKRQVFRVLPVETVDGILDEYTIPLAFEVDDDVQPWVGRPASVPLLVSGVPAAGEYAANPATGKVKFGTPPEAGSLYFRMLTTDLTVHNWVPRLNIALVGTVDGSNTQFTVPEIPADYENLELEVSKPGVGLHLVVGSPASSEFTISGAIVNVGIAPYPEEGPPRLSYYFEDQRAGYENTTGVEAPAASGTANPYYAQIRQMAKRLISAKGGDFVLVRKTLASYDPSAGTPGYATEVHPFRGVLTRPRRQNRFDQTIRDDLQHILATLDVVPKVGDQIDVGGEPMHITATERVSPDGVTACLYRMTVSG